MIFFLVDFLFWVLREEPFVITLEYVYLWRLFNPSGICFLAPSSTCHTIDVAVRATVERQPWARASVMTDISKNQSLDGGSGNPGTRDWNPAKFRPSWIDSRWCHNFPMTILGVALADFVFFPTNVGSDSSGTLRAAGCCWFDSFDRVGMDSNHLNGRIFETLYLPTTRASCEVMPPSATWT